jgi:hypothetical protein
MPVSGTYISMPIAQPLTFTFRVTASTIFFQLIRFFAKVPTTSKFFYANPYKTLHCLHCAFSSKTNYTYGSWRSANSHTESPTDREGRVYSFFIELDIDLPVPLRVTSRVRRLVVR